MKKSRHFPIFLWILALGMEGCQSTPPVALDEKTQKSLDAVKQMCAQKQDHYFIEAELRGNDFPRTPFEGSWSSELNSFEADIVGPLGNALATFGLSNELDKTPKKPPLGIPESFQKPLAWIQLLSPMDFRNIVCGRVFFTLKPLSSQSHIFLSNPVLVAGPGVLSMTSEILWDSFWSSEKSLGFLSWSAQIDGSHVKPKYISLDWEGKEGFHLEMVVEGFR
jgi:hypothetical protein